MFKVATDKVTVAGLTVKKQAFGAIDDEYGGFGSGVSAYGNAIVIRYVIDSLGLHQPNSGLLGLGFPAK